ncbi:MAG: PAS domain S-box protein [Coriobacteriia bacterium]|nr:PAS domain S-box protein [Coriobacteriia bacterium]
MIPMAESVRETEERRQAARDVSIVAAMLSAVVLLHLFTSTAPEHLIYHTLYRRLAYLPVLFAAFRFGLRGGTLTALAAAIPFAIHAQMSLGGLLGGGGDNLLEIVMYVVIGALFGSLRDIEERKTMGLREVGRQLEDAYRKLEERAIQLINIQDYTQSILRSITSGVITIGPDGSVATVNPAAERILGMSEFEVVPKAIRALFSDDAGLGNDVMKVLEGRLPKAVREVTLVTRGGKTIHAQVSASRMRAVGGRILGAVVTIEDISEVKALTEQLIRADRLAALGELTAGVAHEVRNPLGIIRASVQLVEEAQCDPARLREATGVVKQEIDRLDKVIKALLDFGRPSPPTLVRTDVEDVLRDVVLFTRRFAGRRKVRIRESFPGDLPPVLGDPDQLKQVFLNLVTNAVQVMGEEGGTVEVRTGTENGFVVAEVRDDGPGMAPEELGKIFDPFYSKRPGGTGLGLTIVHRIVDEHDGHIEVRSTEGRGTVFMVSLPAQSGAGGMREEHESARSHR